MPTAAPRWILHVDLDQFLASVELLRHPELAGLPVIVGGNGDPTEPRKVVTCASYEARAYGVRAGMPLRTAARRCPEATFLPSNPAAYNAASEEVVALLRDLGYPVEVWGWDEAYLAVAPGTPDDPIEVAEEIRKVILSQTGLSCSIGISDNKQRAKIATGLAKPAGIYQLTDANWMAIMGDRTVEALWGVGVFGIEVEVETGAGYPCAKADSAHRQFRERCLLQQFACGPQNRLAMPVTTPSHRRRSLLLVCGMTGHLLITPLTLHHGV